MRIDIISAVPELIESFFAHSILQRAQKNNLLELHLHNLRDYTTQKQKQIDDYQYGGGAGMVLMCEPIANCILALKEKTTYDEIIFLTPDGETFQQQMANQYSLKKNLILLCGHYKGIDERVRELFVTKEISIGDYVLSGGELPAAVFVDSVVRLLPGVLNNETSALTDSFQDNLLAPPIYTRPREFNGLQVPTVLFSGNFQQIEEWRLNESIKKTKLKKPNLLSE